MLEVDIFKTWNKKLKMVKKKVMILTLMNCGLASLTVAIRQTLSLKAEWRDRWITPSKLFWVQLGTGEDKEGEKS